MNKKNIFKKILISLIFLLVPLASSAQLLTPPEGMSSLTDEFTDSVDLPDSDPAALIAGMIRLVLSFLAIIFLVLIIMSGITWMTAGGDEEKVKKAKTTLQNAVIGLFIVFAAYTITYFIFTSLPLANSSKPQAV